MKTEARTTSCRFLVILLAKPRTTSMQVPGYPICKPWLRRTGELLLIFINLHPIRFTTRLFIKLRYFNSFFECLTPVNTLGEGSYVVTQLSYPHNFYLHSHCRPAYLRISIHSIHCSCSSYFPSTHHLFIYLRHCQPTLLLIFFNR